MQSPTADFSILRSLFFSTGAIGGQAPEGTISVAEPLRAAQGGRDRRSVVDAADTAVVGNEQANAERHGVERGEGDLQSGGIVAVIAATAGGADPRWREEGGADRGD